MIGDRKGKILKMQKDIENIIMITIKHLRRNQISALNNPKVVDMLLNNSTNQLYVCIRVTITMEFTYLRPEVRKSQRHNG